MTAQECRAARSRLAKILKAGDLPTDAAHIRALWKIAQCVAQMDIPRTRYFSRGRQPDKHGRQVVEQLAELWTLSTGSSPTVSNYRGATRGKFVDFVCAFAAHLLADLEASILRTRDGRVLRLDPATPLRRSLRQFAVSPAKVWECLRQARAQRKN